MVLATSLSFCDALLVIYIPGLNVLFKTQVLSIIDWLKIIGFGIVPFIAGELYKLGLRLFSRQKA